MTTKHRLALAATVIGSGIVFLDGTIVNIALPKIGANFHASFAGLQWMIDGYLLTLAALILLGGSLGDVFGRKKIFTYGLIGFGLASAACGLAPNLITLVIFRLIQGAFGAMLVPGSLAIINATFPKESRGAAIGTWTAFSGITTAIAPLVGGWVLDTFSWRWIFFINLPLAALCLYLTMAGVEESRNQAASRRLDLLGCVLAVAGLGGLTYGLIQGPVSNWSASSLAPLIAGAVLLALFVIFEARSRDPMMDLKLFRSRNFSGTNLATLTMYGALSGAFFILVIYLQTTMKYSSLAAGSCLIPITIILFLLSTQVGKWAAKIGTRLFMTIGPIVAGGGLLMLLPLKPGGSFWTGIFPGIVVFGVGLAVTVAPLTTTVMSAVDESHSGIASAINNAVSRIGGLVVVALLGILVASQIHATTNRYASQLGTPTAVAAIDRAVANGQVDSSLSSSDRALARRMITESSVNSYKLSLLLCAGLAIAAGLTSYATIRNKVA